ncbi:DUF4842 domain-containing protein [Phocaeicola sp.]
MKKNILLLIICLGLFSCSKTHDLFDTNRVKEESKENFPTQDIDPDHDWNMAGIRALKISINQKADEVYTVKVYTANPLNEQSDAKLMAKREGVKDGEILTLSFDMPKTAKYVYVLLEDKIYNHSVKMVDMTDTNPSVSWGTKDRNVRSVNVVIPSKGIISYIPPTDNDFYNEIPAGANKYPTEWTNVLEGDYYLENCDLGSLHGGTVGSYNLFIKGTVSLGAGGWPDGTKVYVLPNSTLKMSNGLTLLAGTALYIAKAGKLETSSIELTGETYSQLYNRGNIIVSGNVQENSKGNNIIYNEGKFNVSNGNLMVTNNTTFINLSEIEAKNLVFSANGKFINEAGAEVNVKELVSLANKENILENNGFFKTASLHTDNGVIYNNCQFVVVGGANLEGATIQQDGAAYFEANEMKMSNTVVKLGSEALFYIKSAMHYQTGTTIEGAGDKKALLFVNAICQCGWNSVTYTGNLKVAVKGHNPENDLYNTYYSTRRDAEIISLEQVKLGSSNGCGNSYTTDNGGHEGEGDASQIYTYAFEDITTKGGDYDFNDVVLKVETVPVDNKLKVSLVAAGAQKNLKVYYNAGKSSEKILFGGKEVHEALGGAAGEIINTTGQRDKYSPVDDYIPYQEGKSLSEYGDFSIYDMDNRMYVRLPNRYFNDDFNRGDVPYAIMVPTDWYYPDEHQRIDNRYNFFKGWAENKDKYTLWYTQNSWEDSNTYPYDDK